MGGGAAGADGGKGHFAQPAPGQRVHGSDDKSNRRYWFISPGRVQSLLHLKLFQCVRRECQSFKGRRFGAEPRSSITRNEEPAGHIDGVPRLEPNRSWVGPRRSADYGRGPCRSHNDLWTPCSRHFNRGARRAQLPGEMPTLLPASAAPATATAPLRPTTRLDSCRRRSMAARNTWALGRTTCSISFAVSRVCARPPLPPRCAPAACPPSRLPCVLRAAPPGPALPATHRHLPSLAPSPAPSMLTHILSPLLCAQSHTRPRM